jgi:hypothetical protein
VRHCPRVRRVGRERALVGLGDVHAPHGERAATSGAVRLRGPGWPDGTYVRVPLVAAAIELGAGGGTADGA